MVAVSTLKVAFAAASLLYAAPCYGQLDDAAALFQRTQDLAADEEHEEEMEPALTEAVVTESSPMVVTKLGRIKGRYEDSSYIFKGIPYAEVPERFSPAEFKQPWKGTLEATRWGDACMGASLGGKEQTGAVKESEDCLKMTVWVPKGSMRSLPVMVYFHGGQNQRGSAQDERFQGDLITKNAEYPVILVSFDYRLGIFGWIQGYGVTANLGLRDQQMALDFVRQNIAAFGGNPHKVTVWGHSEGASNILAHLVSPQSAGLFQKAILHSPPADFWSRITNKVRTNYIVKGSGCAGLLKGEDMLKCLRALPAYKLLKSEWKGAELSHQVGSEKWTKEVEHLQDFERSIELPDNIPTFMGWEPVPDGHIVPQEPRLLIKAGKWNRMPVVITMTRNESMGMMKIEGPAFEQVMSGLFHDYDKTKARYVSSLEKTNAKPKDETSLLHAMITDKMWTCDIRQLATDMTNTGGQVHVGMFAHAPKYDPKSGKVNKECEHGAVCQGSELYFAFPQGRGKGIPTSLGFAGEIDLAKRYSQEFLKFASGAPPVWEAFNRATKPITFYDKNGPYVLPNYRHEQCDILDNSMGQVLPDVRKNAVFTSRLPPLQATTTNQPMSLKKKGAVSVAPKKHA
eukprot:CAMPEP_0171191914 /NCGR_PEP_ID=MMETSP0790-20130122/19604_1 /TAXON_ID=2925 /ORGANISM="Alexandrium catenella, Strain OF101" /LENGTH=625 /DNA_ID=CAMNT_0011657065 /DNA_START=95 /DNA_END=1972 /DNA_ORIENTATION=-